jgi:hypothetical protein
MLDNLNETFGTNLNRDGSARNAKRGHAESD